VAQACKFFVSAVHMINAENAEYQRLGLPYAKFGQSGYTERLYALRDMAREADARGLKAYDPSFDEATQRITWTPVER